jgi:nitrogen regulatory protein PII
MAYLVVLVLDDPDQTEALLNAWEKAGARGVTILESSGIGRVRRAALRDDMPLLPSLRDIMRGEEEHHRTFFSVVESEEQVEALAEAAQRVVGDFSQPDTGLIFSVPISHVYGLHKAKPVGKAKGKH